MNTYISSATGILFNLFLIGERRLCFEYCICKKFVVVGGCLTILLNGRKIPHEIKILRNHRALHRKTRINISISSATGSISVIA